MEIFGIEIQFPITLVVLIQEREILLRNLLVVLLLILTLCDDLVHGQPHILQFFIFGSHANTLPLEFLPQLLFNSQLLFVILELLLGLVK